MQITVLKETEAGEQRVALTPDAIKKLVGMGAKVAVESGAGVTSGVYDGDYEAAGASLSEDRATLLNSADVLVTVNRPTVEDMAQLREGAVLIGFLRPLDEPDALRPLIAGGQTAFAMELLPRITRAQYMDALSSMATIAGYKAVVLAADYLPRMFPLLSTAAGTVPPAKGLVLGAGVAGLHLLQSASAFSRGMSGGLGFVALAVMIIGRWHPLGALAGAALLGFFIAVQSQLNFQQAVDIPPQFTGMIPYVLTIVVLAVAGISARPPAAGGQPYEKEG